MLLIFYLIRFLGFRWYKEGIDFKGMWYFLEIKLLIYNMYIKLFLLIVVMSGVWEVRISFLNFFLLVELIMWDLNIDGVRFWKLFRLLDFVVIFCIFDEECNLGLYVCKISWWVK